jgi:hypothetical protein
LLRLFFGLQIRSHVALDCKSNAAPQGLVEPVVPEGYSEKDSGVAAALVITLLLRPT